MKHVLLIVDDNEAILRLLTVVFDKKYTVFTASDGVEAISLLSEGIMPNLIISDLQMPNISGYELARHCSTSNIYNNIPIIILSDAPEAEQAADVMQLPVVTAMYRKPFDPVELLKAVEDIVGNHHLDSRMLGNRSAQLLGRFHQTFSKS
jgi:two-component system chemotaxis response regulator CheY